MDSLTNNQIRGVTTPTPKLMKLARSHAKKWLLVPFIIAIVAFSIVPIHNQIHSGRSKDYALWYSTGQKMLHGGDLYELDEQGQFLFMYPPSAAAILAPPASMGKLALIIFLGLITSASWLACIFCSVYLTTGYALREKTLLYLIPSLCCLFYFYDVYLLGQPAVVLLACMLGAMVCLRHKIEWAAGALLAFATAIKAFPILVIAYLIYRRHWRTTIFLLLFTAIFLFILPAGFRGFGRATDDFVNWSKHMVLKYDATSIAQRPDRGYSWKNNSLQSVANRLLRPIPADHTKKDDPIFVNVLDLPFRLINIVIVSAALCLCLSYLLLMPSTANRTARSDAIEYAMLLLLILVFTPLSFNYNWCWLLFPITLVVNFILDESVSMKNRKLATIWLIVSLVIFALSLPLPVLQIPRATGNTFWASILLFAELGWLLRFREKDVSAAPALAAASN